MTLSELLALLGQAWSRLALYPGGLAAIGLMWLLARAEYGAPANRQNTSAGDKGASASHKDTKPLGASVQSSSGFVPLHLRGIHQATLAPALALSGLALPWLGLALLPLPFAPPLGRKLDLPAALALLEWPVLLRVACELRAPGATSRVVGWRRLAAWLNGLPTLALASLALAQVAGSFDIAPLARPPAADQPLALHALHWLGALAFTLALPALLGYGPFAAAPPFHAPPLRPSRPALLGWLGWLANDGLRLRAVGLAGLAALPWLAPLGALQEEGPHGAAAIGASLAGLLVLPGLLWIFGWLAARTSARRWAWGLLGLDLLLVAAMAWAAGAQLG